MEGFPENSVDTSGALNKHVLKKTDAEDKRKCNEGENKHYLKNIIKAKSQNEVKFFKI